MLSARSLRKCIESFRFLNKQKINFFTTHFGFETVDEQEKQAKVNQVFKNVAEKYDMMNDVMSFGIHRFWKDEFVRSAMPTTNLNCLDVAGGTGDIAFRLIKYAKHIHCKHSDHTGPHITICDINSSMMEIGKLRAGNNAINNIQWVEGNAENLPFGDATFDLYTIAFGIRNCTHIEKVLLEASRVLRPWGRFYCLEFSQVNNGCIRSLYDAYSMRMIPVLGQLIAGDWNSYQYLVESIRRFPNQQEFANLIERCGFKHVRWTDYAKGIVAVHSGFNVSK